ncbi:MAG: carboxypeptidase regulatory-like domain-containing protein, partial [Candidatus Verstraetearchaeota archaeon]|nr:carboxypeptidase regulatory-like domain-containing protein [Candidatus Verstraetearchaeota archaeon]
MPMDRRARQQLLLTLIVPLLFVPFLIPSPSSSNLVNVYVKVYCYASQEGTTIALPGALVSIYTTSWALVAQAQTNSSGIANFTLPKGKYFIVVSADGYYPKKITVWLKKSSKEVNIKLAPKPPLLLSSSFQNITVTPGKV